MAKGENTIWESFLAPVVRFLIDEEEMQRYAKSVDWQKESDRHRNLSVELPEYYSSKNFHGIENGYLNPTAAISYDPITQYVLPPNETWNRQALIDVVKVKPQRILDLGCGTGSTTLMLKQAFPTAEVIGLDLSPYMLVRAEHKAMSANLDIRWCHGNAENTGFANASFDLVTAALLFHETPTSVSINILRECWRLLKVGGQVVIFDGNQKTLRQLKWLNNVFEEPYIRDYSVENVDAWMDTVGFGAVRTQDVWWMNQVTSGIKPIHNNPVTTTTMADTIIDNQDWQGYPSPAFETTA
ncbi:class I SAM-dependent methyltransferase [Calothrix sp. 336/3]|uniref:class I SAM-dependent methyltransferase n=1 Tax=Calothrix sp. 336/3 TaxID=1337936 RepID=UPI0004E3A16E|nr:class I SAM-dependent methyltransferase [Calothrix sp. 336/3]AKG22040.1 methyltransferase type 11 [Calothrix sp. 336/3]